MPRQYKRIFRVTIFPKLIQEALVEYPETIEEDSSWEDDDSVVANYADDPVKYIMAKDPRKRDTIEMNGEPYRLQNAKKRRGHKTYRTFHQHIIYQALHVALENKGLHRHMTEERRYGNHIKDKEMLRKDYY